MCSSILAIEFHQLSAAANLYEACHLGAGQQRSAARWRSEWHFVLIFCSAYTAICHGARVPLVESCAGASATHRQLVVVVLSCKSPRCSNTAPYRLGPPCRSVCTALFQHISSVWCNVQSFTGSPLPASWQHLHSALPFHRWAHLQQRPVFILY